MSSAIYFCCKNFMMFFVVKLRSFVHSSTDSLSFISNWVFLAGSNSRRASERAGDVRWHKDSFYAVLMNVMDADAVNGSNLREVDLTFLRETRRGDVMCLITLPWGNESTRAKSSEEQDRKGGVNGHGSSRLMWDSKLRLETHQTTWVLTHILYISFYR